jgi:hypothetical protein
LIVEFRAATTWWNEICAFDNVRITAGLAPPPTVSINHSAGKVQVSFTGVLQSATKVEGPYTDVAGNPASPYMVTPASGTPTLFLRARSP